MFLDPQSFIVFVGAFIVCGALLGMIFFNSDDFQVLRRMAGMPTAPVATREVGNSPAAVKQAIAEAADEADEGDGDGEEEEAQPEGDGDGATQTLMKFLEGSIAVLIKEKIQISGADKFGANLFLAGAAEVIKDENKLNDQQFVDLLQKALALIGNKPDAAQKLADKYEEYLLEPQYIGTFQDGSKALRKYAKGDEKSVAAMAKTIKKWRNPKESDIAKNDGPITVLFTDIVGSTKITQELGDEGAQKIVRAHNAIVRVALKDHGGTEVKHTGDGIMARFGHADQSVEASVKMLKGVIIHNKEFPALPLHMRIGINAGQPIVEDNDLFGSTVQMAARVCDAAETDGVLVTNIVRELCTGKSLKFKEAGKYGMKGIEGPVVLYTPAP
ncbi:MAG: adenylate/guanylate cyclase domain-containing protein [Proteobacteria bacterium]|nr:adenylate/guanylate cyclase domain-containing protein [Pseudomonadota bacterium]MDA1057238.1 adenylate/guanylate cyclase domain-containing protein [Pseudomonadota bacterium]